MKHWHTLSTAEVMTRLGVDASRGLDDADATQRLSQFGPNELQATARISALQMLVEQFKNVLILILLVAAGLSAILGHGVEAAVIGIIVLFAVALGFIQEFRAERAMEALREMAAPTASVIRAGDERDLPARDLVPGDVILIRAGDRIPADARLVESVNLQIEEAALTGESLAIEKQTASLAGDALAIGDRKNMVYAGTAATYGRGRGVVVETAMKTEFGKIAQLLQTVETSQTPLQQNLDKVGGALARAALVVVVIIVGLGLVRGQPLLEMLIFGIALALAVDPPEKDLMRRKPRNPRVGIFTRPVVMLMSIGGVWSTLINPSLFAWALNSGMSTAEAMTMTFVSLVLIQFFKAYSYRSDRNSILNQPFANKWLNRAIGWELILLALIVYVPFLQEPFGTFGLPWTDWIIVGLAAFTVVPVLEIAKWMERRGWFGALN